MKWFRWYHGTAEDLKFRMLASVANIKIGEAVAVWALMLEYASRHEPRGYFEELKLDHISVALGVDPDTISVLLQAMIDVDMLSWGRETTTHDNGLQKEERKLLRIAKWDERQFESDRDGTARDRQRRKRLKNKESGHGHVTRDMPVSHSRVTAPDTDTDTERKGGAKRAHQLSEESLPDAWKDYCEQKRPDLSPASVFENFRDYYLGHGKPMKDWLRTWQRWVRNEKTVARKEGGGVGTAPGGVPSSWVKITSPDEWDRYCDWVKRPWMKTSSTCALPRAEFDRWQSDGVEGRLDG